MGTLTQTWQEPKKRQDNEFLKGQSYRTFFSLIAKRDPKSAHKPSSIYQKSRGVQFLCSYPTEILWFQQHPLLVQRDVVHILRPDRPWCFSFLSVKRQFYRIALLQLWTLHVGPLSVRRHTKYRRLAVSTGQERTGLPAAPFGKTPAAEALTEYDLPPAELFTLLFYRLHKG